MPGFGCSRSACACDALAPHWPAPCPGRVYSLSPPAARRLGRKGMRFSRSDVKVLLANYAIICAPGAMPPWFTDTVSLTRGFKKPSPASAGPGCRNTRCLGWFPDTPCKCSGWEEGWASHTDQERHHAPALSGLTANSVTASPRFFHSRSLEEPREGFPAALGKQHCFPPLQQTSAFKHENIINLLLSHNTHLPEQGDMKFRA